MGYTSLIGVPTAQNESYDLACELSACRGSLITEQPVYDNNKQEEVVLLVTQDTVAEQGLQQREISRAGGLACMTQA